MTEKLEGKQQELLEHMIFELATEGSSIPISLINLGVEKASQVIEHLIASTKELL